MIDIERLKIEAEIAHHKQHVQRLECILHYMKATYGDTYPAMHEQGYINTLKAVQDVKST